MCARVFSSILCENLTSNGARIERKNAAFFISKERNGAS